MQTESGRILVVDDNEMNRDLLSRRVRRQGHEVAVAEHGRQALEMIAAQPFDLVLLDIQMPEMNGYEVLERLKADPALRHLPVIMITALDDEDTIARCIQMGAEDHLPKPFNPVVLRARIEASLAKKRLRDREQLYAQSLERDLEIGRRIQAGFFPEQLPQPAGWEIAARFRPARQVAGDFYDAFPLDGGHIGLVIADVCDKGVGAALFMALFRSLTRALAQQAQAADGDDPDATTLRRTVTALNDYIAETHSRANMFATMFFGVLDPATGDLQYINAGHEPPAIVGAGDEVRRLSPTGPAVGLLPKLEFGVRSTAIGPGELFFAFTDGVTDARDAAGTDLSEARMLGLLATPHSTAAAVLDRVEAEVQAHTGGSDAFDDITLLAVRREVNG